MRNEKTRGASLLAGLLLAGACVASAQAQEPAAAAGALMPAEPAADTGAPNAAAGIGATGIGATGIGAAGTGAAGAADAAAVDAGLRKRLQAVVAALNGKGKLAADSFSELFLQQSSVEVVQKALDSLRGNVGTCQPVGRMQTSNPAATSVLLNCQKAYMPLELAVANQAPYRITGVLLRPAYWK